MGRLQVNQYEYILNKHKEKYGNVKTYIETGTWQGEQLAIASNVFEKVIGIELSSHWHEVSVKATEDKENVQVIHGDTKEQLPILLKTHEDPLFIMLDAHFCSTHPPIEKSEFPLWDELKVLKARPQNDIIIVDDTHTFGRHRPELKKDQNVKEWEDVTVNTIKEFFGDLVFDSEVIGGGFVVWKKQRYVIANWKSRLWEKKKESKYQPGFTSVKGL